MVQEKFVTLQRAGDRRVPEDAFGSAVQTCVLFFIV